MPRQSGSTVNSVAILEHLTRRSNKDCSVSFGPLAELDLKSNWPKQKGYINEWRVIYLKCESSIEGRVALIDPNRGTAVLSSSVPTLSGAILNVYMLILGDLLLGVDVSFTNHVSFAILMTNFVPVREGAPPLKYRGAIDIGFQVTINTGANMA